MKEKFQWLTTLIKNNAAATAIAALIVAVGGQMLEFRQDQRVEFRDVANEYREEANRLRDVERKCISMELQLNKQMDALRGKMILLESASQDLPFPHWLKSTGTKRNPGIMMSVNRAFEDRYLIPVGKTAQDYIGKTDAQFWGPELGDRYWEGELKVIESGAPTDRYEKDPTGIMDSVRVVRYPRSLGTRVIGIGGMELPVRTKKK